MGDLLIRNVPEELKRELSEAARRAGRSLSDEAKEALRSGMAAAQRERDLARSSAYDDFRQTFAEALLNDDEHAEMMRAIEDWKQESLPSKVQAAE